MKILFFTENFYCGGLDSFLINLINNWPYPKDHFTIICNKTHPGLSVIASSLNRPCRIIPHRITFYAELSRRTNHMPTINFFLRMFSPLLRYLFFAYYVKALRKFFSIENPDRLMIINGGYPGGDTCRAASIAWGLLGDKPLSIHNFHNFSTPPRWWEKWMENKIDSLVFRSSQFFISVSKACLQSVKNRPPIGMTKKNICIYNGIDSFDSALKTENGANVKQDLGLPESSLMCLMLGTYEPRKGHDFLLRSFQIVHNEIPQTHLVICGYGSKKEMDDVKRLVEKYELDSYVHIFGFRTDTAQLLRHTDVLLVSSQEYESFGFTSVEAMSVKTPVVVTNTGGIPEVVKNGEGGYCVDRHDVRGYAQKIILLLKNDKLRKEQGEKGYQRFLNLFTADRMAEQYAKLIRFKQRES